MFTLVDGSSSTQSPFDLMVAWTRVLNAETAVSEIGRVFIRKELGSGLKWETNLPFSSAFVPPPLAANMLRTQDPISLEMSCFAKHNLFTNQICLVLQKRICSHEDVLDQYYWSWFDLVKVFISCNWRLVRLEPLSMTLSYFLPHMASSGRKTRQKTEELVDRKTTAIKESPPNFLR